MRVVVKQPGKLSTVEMVKPGLETFQKIVDGYIECAMKAHEFFDKDDLVVYCNEEGLLKQLPLNVFRPTDEHPIVGAIVALKVDADGDDVSMTEADAERVRVLLDDMMPSGPVL